MPSLDDLRKSSSNAAPLEESSMAPGGSASLQPVEPQGLVTSSEDSSNGEAPRGVHEVVTSNGLQIYYQAGPKRLYRIRRATTHGFELAEAPKWVDVPSVSDVLGILDKPGLPWWGMKIGIEGLCTLNDIITGDDAFSLAEAISDKDVDCIVDLLTQHKLTVNHVRDKAGDRGTSVHDSLQLWADEGILPNPDVFGPAEKGYVQGLRTFLETVQPLPIMCEAMVASMLYGFAGRPDLVVEIPEDVEVISKSYPKRKSKVEVWYAGRYLLDLKTSKGVYESHHLQLAAYEIGLAEAWNVVPDGTGIIHVFPDGRYELIEGKAVPQDFVVLRDLYDTMQRLK